MNTTHYDLVEHSHIMANSTRKQKDEYYDSFVVLDGCRAIVAHFEDFDEACSWARTEARHAKAYHRTLTLEVYGCDSEGYSTDENDSTLVYSTDEDVNCHD